MCHHVLHHHTPIFQPRSSDRALGKTPLETSPSALALVPFVSFLTITLIYSPYADLVSPKSKSFPLHPSIILLVGWPPYVEGFLAKGEGAFRVLTPDSATSKRKSWLFCPSPVPWYYPPPVLKRMPFFSTLANDTLSPRNLKLPLFLSAWMEDMQRSQRCRVYPLKPNAIMCTGFTRKYVSHLLPALTKATTDFSCGGNKEENVEKMVRFEVDMALVLSADGFKWSRALKHGLEQRSSSDQLHRFTLYQSSIQRVNKHKMVDHLRAPGSIPRPLDPTKANRPKRACRRSHSKKTRGEEEFGCRISILRRILPGGNEMDPCELLSEVESYVVCLQLQVNILKSLVETPGSVFSSMGPVFSEE